MVVGNDAVVPALGHAADGQDDDGKGRHFDAAARGAGSRADKLQDAHKELGDGPAGSKVDGVHAGGTGGNGLEQRRHQLIGRGKPAHGGGVRPLHQGNERGAPHPEDDREGQHHPGLQRKAALFAPLADFHPDHEAQTTRHDHKHDDGLHIVVVDVGHQGRIRSKAAEQVKACVAESRNGGKNADPDALRAELRHQGGQQ